MNRFNPGKYGADGSCMELNEEGRYVRWNDLPKLYRWWDQANERLTKALKWAYKQLLNH